LCQRLLREAGFVQVNATGRSGDGGIDGHGTLQINPLVSFKVLFQCKRLLRRCQRPKFETNSECDAVAYEVDESFFSEFNGG
jgi:restriction endonuclease Mrr